MSKTHLERTPPGNSTNMSNDAEKYAAHSMVKIVVLFFGSQSSWEKVPDKKEAFTNYRFQ